MEAAATTELAEIRSSGWLAAGEIRHHVLLIWRQLCAQPPSLYPPIILSPLRLSGISKAYHWQLPASLQ